MKKKNKLNEKPIKEPVIMVNKESNKKNCVIY